MSPVASGLSGLQERSVSFQGQSGRNAGVPSELAGIFVNSAEAIKLAAKGPQRIITVEQAKSADGARQFGHNLRSAGHLSN